MSRLVIAGLTALLLPAIDAAAQTAAPAQSPRSVFKNCNILPFLMRALGSASSKYDNVKGTYKDSGDVMLRCDDIALYADEIEWSDKDQIVHARGRVTFEQGTAEDHGDRAELNNTTKLGVFYGADGTARISTHAVRRREACSARWSLKCTSGPSASSASATSATKSRTAASRRASSRPNGGPSPGRA